MILPVSAAVHKSLYSWSQPLFQISKFNALTSFTLGCLRKLEWHNVKENLQYLHLGFQG